jgi:hypothetical protein
VAPHERHAQAHSLDEVDAPISHLVTNNPKEITGAFVFLSGTDTWALKQEWQPGYYERDAQGEVIMAGRFPAKWVEGPSPDT